MKWFYRRRYGRTVNSLYRMACYEALTGAMGMKYRTWVYEHRLRAYLHIGAYKFGKFRAMYP